MSPHVPVLVSVIRHPLGWFIFLALVAGTAGTSAAQIRVEGTVLNAVSRTPLGGAHIIVSGTTIGAVTNDEGRFAVIVPRLPAELRMRHIGYETERIRLERQPSGELVVELAPAVVPLEEIVVTGETFAESLMRSVIAQKQIWMADLRTYAAQGFSRVSLQRDGTIMHLSEALFDHYWDRMRGRRAVVTSYSRTAEWYDELPLEPAASVLNLYEDEIDIQGLTFIGPTHPDAHSRYVFRLAGRRMLSDQLVYDVYVSPSDERFATFIGMISVVDSTFAMLRAELRPARHVVFPAPLESWRPVYVQQFERVESGPWLPVGLQVDGTVRVTLDAQRLRVFDIHGRSQLSHYRLNTPLPPAPFEEPGPVVLEETSVLNDPLFLYGRVLMPLTARESEALERLRGRPTTLREAFPPTERGGRWTAFLEGGPGSARLTWPTLYGYQFRFRYNRVDGLLSSIGNTIDLTPQTQLEWRLGQASGLNRVRSHFRVRRRFGELVFAEVEYRRDTRPMQQHSLYSPAAASLQPLFGEDDYFDFFWLQGIRIGAGIEAAGLTLTAELLQEQHRSTEQQLDRSWPFREPFRSNPEISEGTIGAAALTLRWSDSKPQKDFFVRFGEARIEHAPRSLLGSDFSYTHVRLGTEVHLPTLFRRRPNPASLDLRVVAGTSTESLPPQRFAALDGSLSMLGALRISRFGTLRSLHGRPLEGEHHMGVFWQHDFTTWPFERGILWPLAHRGSGLILFGGHGRTWMSEGTLDALPFRPNFRNNFIHEIGLSLTRIGGTPIRGDFTIRLDAPGISVGIGAITF